MKKLFTLAVALTLALGINAQGKKTWDFTQGLSDETIENLNADTGNWAPNGTDGEGITNNWQNSTKQSADSYWMANGVIIPELEGLKIDIGSNKANSIHLATTKLRLTRKNTKITFPKLANGQKITIVGRSANSTATNRGIAPVQSYIKFQAEESSSQTGGACIFLGNQAEGSEGTYTFVWKVETEETDSVDIQFQLTPDAGIDFTLFMIDQGDAPEVKDAQPVAYLYDGSADEDFGYIYLSGDSRFALTEINVAETEATADSLRKFEGVVISPTIGADNAYLPTIKQTIAFVPVLNLNPNLYEALGYGRAVKTSATGISVTDKYAESDIFTDLDISENLDLISDGGLTAVELGDYFLADDTIATAANQVAMHIHNAKRNAYMLLPLTLEDMAVSTDNIATLIPQALQYVMDTKKDVQAVGTPVISLNMVDGHTIVTLSAANSKAIYYTLDGSEPTVESIRYTEPFEVWQLTTVKAFATGDGYTDSKVAEKEVVVKRTASTPTVTVESNENGKAVITLQSPQGIDMYFNFNGATTSALSQKYTEAIVLTEPATLYVMAEGGDWLPSDLGENAIQINGFNGRVNEMAHFDANETDWFMNDAETSGIENQKASAYYFWGKSAWNYYSEEVDHEETVPGSDGNDSIVYYYKPNLDALKVINPLNENGWVLKSEGQVLTGELQLAPEKGVGNGATGRFAEEAIDLLSMPSKGVITFGAKTSGDPYTARIETTKKLQGPFDVVVICGNGNGSGAGVLEIQTSADGETWATLDTLKMAGTQRYFKRTRASFDEQQEVFVRVAQVSGGTKAQVYDIIVLTDDPQFSAIENVKGEAQGDVVRTELFTIGGARTSNATRGISIVRKTYANGVVTTQKVLVK